MMPANKLMRLLISALAVSSCLTPAVGGQGTSTSGHVVERNTVCGYSYAPRFLPVDASIVSLAMLGVDPRDFDTLDNTNSGLKDEIFAALSTATDCANALEWNNFIGRAVQDLHCPHLSSLSMRSVYNYIEYRGAMKRLVSFKSRDDVLVGSRRRCATSSTEFASSVDDEEKKLVQFFKRGGEVVLAEVRCQTHTVSVNLNTSPIFTSNFHRALRKLSFAAENPHAETSRKTYSGFIEDFGTHYQDTTHFGSRLLIMKLFAEKATSPSEKIDRHRCVSSSFTQNLHKDSSFDEVVEHFNRVITRCDSKRALDVLNSLGLPPTRILTVGTVPLPDLDQTFQRPVPIQYKLEKIQRMFQEDWFDGLGCSVNGTVMQEFFENMTSQERHAPNDTSCARKVGCGYSDNCKLEEKCYPEQHSQRGYICVSTKPGRAVILGGNGGGGSLRTVEQVNLESFPELPTSRAWTAAATSGQHVVVCWGWVELLTSTDGCYKISLNSPDSGWEAMPSAPRAKFPHTAVSIDQYIVWFMYERHLVVFDGETQSFSTLNLPFVANYFHCSVSNGTHAYIVGAGGRREGIWVNEGSMDGTEWRKAANIIRGRERHACLWYGSNIMITGGMTEGPEARSDVEMFNTETGEVWAGQPLLTGRAGHQMMLLDGKPTVIGGIDNNGAVLNTLESFSLESNRWEKLERTLASARQYFALVQVYK